jgi:N-acetyl-alpha-D-glucosaminyl L-malate synthase BshA
MTSSRRNDAGPGTPAGGAPLSIGVVCYPSLGGSGVVASELATGFAERGHRVHVIASAPPGRALRALACLRFHEVAVSDYPLFEHPPYPLAVAAKIVEVATTARLDLVHVHYAVPHAAAAYLARQALGAAAPRIVTTLHGTDVTRDGIDRGYQPITRFTVAASDGITVPSAFLRREAYRLLDLHADLPLEVIPNFVDTEHFTPAVPRDRGRFAALFPEAGGDTDGPILVHVSNFRAVKRPADLIDVLARVRQRAPARLVLVGDGPERASTAARARALGVADAVCFRGEQADVVEELRHADVFLLARASESFGVAALEAMSAGVPVVAYRVGGLSEVVTAATGRLVPAGDVAMLAAAVVEVVTDPERHAALARAARAHALEHFRREPALDRYVAYFRTVLAAPARRERSQSR